VGRPACVHIGVRNAGKGEDPRYRKWREEWGAHAALRSFLQIFLLQQYLVLVVLAPVTYVIWRPGGPPGLLDAVGVSVWTIGFAFEALGTTSSSGSDRSREQGQDHADRALEVHPSSELFRRGDALVGRLPDRPRVPGGWMTIAGPVMITFLIIGVSGVPMLEKKYEGNAEFDEYKRRTSAFFPLPPKA